MNGLYTPEVENGLNAELGEFYELMDSMIEAAPQPSHVWFMRSKDHYERFEMAYDSDGPSPKTIGCKLYRVVDVRQPVEHDPRAIVLLDPDPTGGGMMFLEVPINQVFRTKNI